MTHPVTPAQVRAIERLRRQLPDGSYRQVLLDVAGVSSPGRLSIVSGRRVIDRLAALAPEPALHRPRQARPCLFGDGA